MDIAFITGANKGIGLATAERLGGMGVRVVVGAREQAKGAAAVAELVEKGVEAVAVEIDVTDDNSVRAAAELVRAEHGRVDILINNAGILPEAAAAHRVKGPMDIAMFRETFATNLFGVVTTTAAFLPLLLAAPRGRIVNVSSTVGSLADQSDPTSAYHGLVVPAYQASKAALNSITIGLSKSLADTNMKVNAVCPGWVQTDLGGPHNRAAAPTTPADAAHVVVDLALLDSDGPTGGFFDADGPVRW
ncbi:SDR family NAD(P)-dependent oxidoreductase [Baekduia sp. Peel2402]|uniref:SDR family NAD(P)-dependent oxidoreductase n=1 Tax=Baekduia sp. Peel2402 TaxID=3458296 RepID=UPI00403ED870